MMNRVELIGRMTKDPELRRTQAGNAVVSFTLAIDRNYVTNNKERQTDFINCVVWNKTAENVERYCTKGALVGIEGRLQSRNYEGTDGKRVYVVEVLCDLVSFLEPKTVREYREQSQEQPNQLELDDFTQDFDIPDEDEQY